MKEKDRFGLTSKDWAYIAGFMDADGCFYINRSEKGCVNPQYMGGTSCSNTNPLVPKWLRGILGGGCYHASGRGENHKDQYRWQLTGQKAIPFLKSVIPFLRMKQERAQLLLDFILYQGRERTKALGKGRKKGAPYSVITCTNFDVFYQKMRKLNQVGPPLQGLSSEPTEPNDCALPEPDDEPTQYPLPSPEFHILH